MWSHRSSERNQSSPLDSSARYTVANDHNYDNDVIERAVINEIDYFEEEDVDKEFYNLDNKSLARRFQVKW